MWQQDLENLAHKCVLLKSNLWIGIGICLIRYKGDLRGNGCVAASTLLQEACGTYRPKWCFCGRSCQINWVTVYSDGSNQSCTYLLVHGTNRQHANSASKSCHPKCEKPRYERNKFTSIKISRTVCLIFQNYNFIVSWYYSATNTKIEIMEEMEIFYF